ncbi:MAG: nucleotidyltransferase family protein [Gammaproteobacteria bacterium]
MSRITGQFTAVVLAGDRNDNDPLVKATGASCKALVEIGNRPMVLHVLDALQAASNVGKRILSGPGKPQLSAEYALQKLINDKSVHWVEPEKTPSTSAYFAMQNIQIKSPILLTTADHPLLTSEMIERFCSKSNDLDVDVVVGLCRYDLIKTSFPNMKKTIMKFSDGDYCGCNLFAFLTPESRRIANTWRQIESDRKNPIRIIRMLGWLFVLRYLFGTLSLTEAVARLSRQLELRIGIVDMPYAEAAVDVDSIADKIIVQDRFKSKTENTTNQTGSTA